MNRPNERITELRNSHYLSQRELGDYILSLESELAKLKGEEEEVWEKIIDGTANGYAKIVMGEFYAYMPIEIVDEILRNRQIVKRGIDWKRFWSDYSKRRTVHDLDAGAIQSLIESQLKGDVK